MDTSGLISAVNDRSASYPSYPSYRETAAFLSELRRATDTRLLVSPFILAEVDYLLSDREKRPDIARGVLRDIADGRYRLELFDSSDVARAADIIETYSDQNIGIADASNVILAERRDTLDVLTLDERHFRVLRGPGGMSFRLLPADR